MSPRAIRNGVILGLLSWIVVILGVMAVASSCSAQDQVLSEVNERVNGHIRYVRQDDGMATARVMPDYGDCDDYAWSKFILLSRAGVEWDRMRMAYVTTRRGESHVVVVVDGRWVLDNIERRVVSVDIARRYYTGL